MRVRITTVLAAAAIALTACSSSTPKSADKPADAVPPAASQPAASSPAAAPAALQLGQPPETIGAGGAGRLEITPASVVYVPAPVGSKPMKDTFAFITYKARATTAVAADQAAPIDRGGWSWVAPDGLAIEQGNGEAYNVVSDSFNAGRTVQPGTHILDSAVFDLTSAQTGGTLIYTDGEGTAYRWTIPKADSGPDVAQVKKELAP